MVRTFNQMASRGVQFSGAPVLDKTGLTGKFTYDLRFLAPEGVESSTALADALEEQFGLKFVADRGPITVRVIDAIERPTEN